MKLTKTIREEVAKKAAEAVYGQKINEARESLKKLLVEDILASGIRLANSIPPEWVEYIAVQSNCECYISNERHESVQLPVQFAVKDYGRIRVGSYDKPFQGAAEYAALKKAEKDLEKSIMQALNACTTSKHVAETIPELVKYLPDETAPVNALVPIEQVARLRSVLAGVAG